MPYIPAMVYSSRTRRLCEMRRRHRHLPTHHTAVGCRCRPGCSAVLPFGGTASTPSMTEKNPGDQQPGCSLFGCSVAGRAEPGAVGCFCSSVQCRKNIRRIRPVFSAFSCFSGFPVFLPGSVAEGFPHCGKMGRFCSTPWKREVGKSRRTGKRIRRIGPMAPILLQPLTSDL